MEKSNTNAKKILDKSNENIRTNEKVPQVKISDLSIVIYCSKSYYSSIFQRKKLEMYIK